jgi:hypothetical protein
LRLWTGTERAFAAVGRHPILVIWLTSQALFAYWWAYLDASRGLLAGVGYVAMVFWLLSPGSWLVVAVFNLFDAIIGVPPEALRDERGRALLAALWVASASLCYLFWAYLLPGVSRLLPSEWRETEKRWRR